MVIYMFDLLVAKSQTYKTKFAYKLTISTFKLDLISNVFAKTMYLTILDNIRNHGFESDHFFEVEENLKNFSDDSVYVTWFGLSPRAKFGPGLGLNASLGNLSGSLAQNPTNLRI